MSDSATASVSVQVEVSPGELIDKITILEIKQARIIDAAKRRNVEVELETLSAAVEANLEPSDELATLKGDLRSVNEALWDVEDELRVLERDRDFGARFVELARAVYHRNDRRAALKRKINELLGSRLIEEKQYVAY
jgi:hypothetical protein